MKAQDREDDQDFFRFVAVEDVAWDPVHDLIVDHSAQNNQQLKIRFNEWTLPKTYHFYVIELLMRIIENKIKIGLETEKKISSSQPKQKWKLLFCSGNRNKKKDRGGKLR